MANRKSNGDNTSPEFQSCQGNDDVPEFDAFRANQLFSPFFNYVEMEKKETLKQARDSTRVFHNDSKDTISMLLQYPDSPTAVNYCRAFHHFTLASQILRGHKKHTVEDIEDCETLSTAFESIVQGYLYENSMFEPFRPPDTTSVLVEQYLNVRPKDICAEYVKVIILIRASCNSEKGKHNLLSEFESAKLRITTLEMFASKLSMNKDSHPFQKRILIDVYYHLGAIYVSTKQPERALDSFQKCYDLDNTHFSALYGIAYHHRMSDQAKAIELFQKYISMAPKCDKQYPNAYYMIASAYCIQGKYEEASRFCSLAEDAEKSRLPFLSPVSIPQKRMMHNLKHLFAQIKSLKKQNSIK